MHPLCHSFVRTVNPTCHGHTSRTFDLSDVLLGCHSLFLWSTNAHFCLQLIQKLCKSAVISESTKITSHLEVFSHPANETRNQRRNKETMITSFEPLLHVRTSNSVTKEFCVSIPRWHSRGIDRWLGVAPRRIRPVVPAMAPALTGPLIIPIPPRTVRLLLWFCWLRRPVQIRDSWLSNLLNNSSRREQTLRQSASDLHLEEQDSSAPSGRRDRDTLLGSATNHEVWGSFRTSI